MLFRENGRQMVVKAREVASNAPNWFVPTHVPTYFESDVRLLVVVPGENFLRLRFPGSGPF
jgi:hypothetical protein